jgi:hypothetical protein
MNNIRTLLYVSSIIFLSSFVYAAATDYLILEGIGQYRLFTGVPGRVFSGPSSKYSQTATGGVLAAAGHFSEGDMSYEASYTEPGGKWPFIKVEVTQHAGTDSDKWLLHEVERGFRDTGNFEATPAEDTMIRELNGNKIFFYGGGVVGYRWISNNVVINIQYTNLGGAKPEPLEVVRAYLTKFPSSIALTDNDLKAKPHNEQWIKDEMERRLWLCDKWFVRLESDRSKLSSILKTIADHIVVFLDYREKYYGISGKDDKLALMGYLSAKNEAGIRAKLTAYKNWWNVNKTKSISLP